MLIDAATRTGARLEAFVSTSAIGIYGDTGEREVDETSAPADDFLAKLCVEWEAEASRAAALGARVAIIRVGVVLGDGGGAMAKILPLFRWGLGGKLGSGKQWISWIHLQDIVEAFARAATDDRHRGVFNGAAPHPVTNREMTKVLGKLLHRPTFASAPAVVLKLVLGGAASAVLASQRVYPTRLNEMGFAFAYETIDMALAQITYNAPTVMISRVVAERPNNAYVRTHTPEYVLYDRTLIDAPIGDVFAFFSRAANLVAITPADMAFTIVTPGELTMERGLTIDYRIGIGGVSLNWRTGIEEWVPGERFADAQHKGPYRCWYHEHMFRADGDRTLMEDRVWYAMPLGPLGRIVHAFKVRRMLQRIFEYRTSRVALRFGRARSEGRQPAKQARATATTDSLSAAVS
jgi:ligand-binding SRPBCC domain-containing protein